MRDAGPFAGVALLGLLAAGSPATTWTQPEWIASAVLTLVAGVALVVRRGRFTPHLAGARPPPPPRRAARAAKPPCLGRGPAARTVRRRAHGPARACRDARPRRLQGDQRRPRPPCRRPAAAR